MGLFRRNASNECTEGESVLFAKVDFGCRGGDCWASCDLERLPDKFSNFDDVFSVVNSTSVCLVGEDLGLHCVHPDVSLGFADVLKGLDGIPALDLDRVEWGVGDVHEDVEGLFYSIILGSDSGSVAIEGVLSSWMCCVSVFTLVR